MIDHLEVTRIRKKLVIIKSIKILVNTVTKMSGGTSKSCTEYCHMQWKVCRENLKFNCDGVPFYFSNQHPIIHGIEHSLSSLNKIFT